MKITNIKTAAKEIEGTNILGKASCIVNGTLAINNISIRKNEKSGELYIQMPQMKNAKTDNYLDVAFPVISQERINLNQKILEAFANGNSNTEADENSEVHSDNIDAKMFNVKHNEKSNSPVLAVGSITIDDVFAVKGVKILQNKDGEPFMALPSSYNPNTKKSYTLVAPASKAAYAAISEKAIAAYQSNVNAEKTFTYVSLDKNELEQISKSDIKIDCGKIKDDGSCIARVPAEDKAKLNNLLNPKNTAKASK